MAIPAEGTEAHATLLVAEFLAGRQRAGKIDGCGLHEVAGFVAEARSRYGNYWRKSAREPGAEHELAATALQRLAQLRLISTHGGQVRPLPALARFALGDAELRPATAEAGALEPPALQAAHDDLRRAAALRHEQVALLLQRCDAVERAAETHGRVQEQRDLWRDEADDAGARRAEADDAVAAQSQALVEAWQQHLDSLRELQLPDAPAVLERLAA